MFGNGTSCVELLKDAFVVKEFGELKKFLNSIKDGFTPNYNDFSAVMNKYVVSINNSDFCGLNDLLISLFSLLFTLINDNNK